MVPEICCATDGQTDGQMDEWTGEQMDGKSDRQRWVPHLKKEINSIESLKVF